MLEKGDWNAARDRLLFRALLEEGTVGQDCSKSSADEKEATEGRVAVDEAEGG
jgi:hypothetical protein